MRPTPLEVDLLMAEVDTAATELQGQAQDCREQAEALLIETFNETLTIPLSQKN